MDAAKIDEHFENYIQNESLRDEFSDEQLKEEIEKIKKVLLNKNIVNTDLGGLIALRGFVFQYYVAIYYMVEMIHSRVAWWNAVTFELIDDISLVSDNKIKIIQVKTKREDSINRVINIKDDLTKRSNKGLDSWLDKLFSNNKIIDGKYIQFELATNTRVQEDLEDYCYEKHSINNKDIGIKDKLRVELDKDKIVKDKDGKKNVVFKWKDLNKHSVEWYLNKFNIRYFGFTEIIRSEIIFKITEIIGVDNIAKGISEIVLNSLLVNVMERTHSDNGKNVEKLTFHKLEIEKWIKDSTEEGKNIIVDYSKKQVLKGVYNQVLDDIQAKIEKSWYNRSIRNELLDSLNWIRIEFKKKEKEDVYFYQRFSSKLFDLEDKEEYMINDTKHKGFLYNSLEFMIFFLTFYDEKELLFDNTQLIFKKVSIKDFANRILSVCNMQEDMDINQAKDYIAVKAKECEFSRTLKHDYYCLINDSVECEDIFDEKAFTKDEEFEEDVNLPSIIKTPLNIKYVVGQKFKSKLKSLEKNQDKFKSFKQANVRDKIKVFLNEEA
ncbi:dsDNA nuclease domain-containing protein [Clostridium sp. C8-1-8]|uniref:dsDNA nuclease domain-containing protein n=1 Tax=Clostridium sp. C8-1-8 TaxID=2698831 RepID=UPI00136FDD67|nr:dsDNA nuclease domain-containing protein [Clostridium sp. C8-1-8]